MSTWMREHRNGATAAMVAKVSGTVFIAYTTDPSGLVTEFIDDEVLEVAQASADRAAGCPQPCACPAWLELASRAGAVK